MLKVASKSNLLRVDGMHFLSIDEHILIFWWRNYLYVRPVNSTDHTGRTCMPGSWLWSCVVVVVQRKRDKLLDDINGIISALTNFELSSVSSSSLYVNIGSLWNRVCVFLILFLLFYYYCIVLCWCYGPFMRCVLNKVWIELTCGLQSALMVWCMADWWLRYS